MSGSVTLINPPRQPELKDQILQRLQSSFGADHSGVKAQGGGDAPISAQAFATGKDIAFPRGNAEFGSSLGAHELTHTMQQKGSITR